MNIPDEVQNAAWDAYHHTFASLGHGPATRVSWRVIAEWARREALREAAAVLRGEGEPGHGGEYISVNHAQELVQEIAAAEG